LLEIGKLVLYRDAGLTTAQDTIGRFDFLAELPMGHVGMTAFAALADLDQYEAVVKLLVGGTNREPFRAKMVRQKLSQTSFYRKLLAYEATWTNKIHQRHLGIPRFRVLTVTTSAARVKSLLDACSRLQRGHGLFLFADRSVLQKDLLSPVWQCGKAAVMSALLDLPDQIHGAFAGHGTTQSLDSYRRRFL